MALWSKKKCFNGRQQLSVRLADLSEHLDGHAGQPDMYVSTGVFYKPNRQKGSLAYMPMAFLDLDTYKQEDLVALPPESQLQLLLMACDDKLLPRPSIVVFSGRGLQAKWLFTKPIPAAALPRWEAVQRELCLALAGFGADRNALDPSRVLRLEGSVNSRTGQVVRVLHRETWPRRGGDLMPNGVVGYDFDELARTLLPYEREELAEIRADRNAQRARDATEKAARLARKKNWTVIPGGLSPCADSKRAARRPFIPSELARDRLDDLRTLAKLRGWEKGCPTGQRNTFVFLGAVFLAQAHVVPHLRSEIEAWVADVVAPTWSKGEIRSCVSSVVTRAEMADRGETVEHDGMQIDPRYRFKNKTLVEWLGITGDEAKHLKTILPASETRRRNTARRREARRAAGAIERQTYLAQVDEKRQRVRALKAQGMSNSAIARETGFSRGSVIDYLKD